MFLKKLELSNFRSFFGNHSIDFENGLALIRGSNKDSGDSSGSGKSSVVLAIQWVLGGCPFATNTVQNWDSESPPKVKLTVIDGDKTIEVERQPLKIWVNGEKLPGSAKQLEQELDTLLGLPQEIRDMATYRQQGKPSRFLSMTDSSRKEFLTKVLELDRFEIANKAAQEELKDLKTSNQMLLREVEIADTTVKRLQNDVAAIRVPQAVSLGTPEEWEAQAQEVQQQADAIQASIETTRKAVTTKLDAKIAEIRNNAPVLVVDTEVETLKARQASCRGLLDSLVAENSKKNLAFVKTKSDLETALNQKKQAVVEAAKFQKKLAELEADLAVLNSSTCPRCSQHWVNAQAEITKIEATIERAKTEIGKNTEASGGIPELQESIATLVFVNDPLIDTTRNEINEIQNLIKQKEGSALNAFNTAQQKQREEESVLRSKAETYLVQKNTELQTQFIALRDKASQFLSKAKEIRQSQSDIKAAEAVKARLEKQLVEAQATYTDTVSKLAPILDKQKILEDVVVVTGRQGFLSVIFDEVLAEIQNETNEILAKVANVRHVTVRFDSEKETATGVSKKINIIAIIGGREVPLDAGLSGGMNASVGLAIDLAVGKVCAARRGKYPGWLILDESFDGLGSTSKESCLEMLAVYAGDDKLVLVIDHSSEFQGLFQNVIDIECINGRSVIKQ